MKQLFLLDKTFDELVSELQKSMYKHNKTGGYSLVPTDSMKTFCQNTVPGLFDMVIKSITKSTTGLDRLLLQEKRACQILHNLAYSR